MGLRFLCQWLSKQLGATDFQATIMQQSGIMLAGNLAASTAQHFPHHKGKVSDSCGVLLEHEALDTDVFEDVDQAFYKRRMALWKVIDNETVGELLMGGLVRDEPEGHHSRLDRVIKIGKPDQAWHMVSTAGAKLDLHPEVFAVVPRDDR